MRTRSVPRGDPPLCPDPVPNPVHAPEYQTQKNGRQQAPSKPPIIQDTRVKRGTFSHHPDGRTIADSRRSQDNRRIKHGLRTAPSVSLPYPAFGYVKPEETDQPDSERQPYRPDKGVEYGRPKRRITDHKPEVLPSSRKVRSTSLFLRQQEGQTDSRHNTQGRDHKKQELFGAFHIYPLFSHTADMPVPRSHTARGDRLTDGTDSAFQEPALPIHRGARSRLHRAVSP